MPYKDPEERRAYHKAYNATHTYPPRKVDPEWRRQYYQKWYTPEKRRRYKLRSRFGIEIHEYEAMFEAQGGGCALCGRLNPDGRRLFVDHDHQTGRIRGLLCIVCNRLLAHYDGGTFRQIEMYVKDALEVPY